MFKLDDSLNERLESIKLNSNEQQQQQQQSSKLPSPPPDPNKVIINILTKSHEPQQQKLFKQIFTSNAPLARAESLEIEAKKIQEQQQQAIISTINTNETKSSQSRKSSFKHTKSKSKNQTKIH